MQNSSKVIEWGTVNKLDKLEFSDAAAENAIIRSTVSDTANEITWNVINYSTKSGGMLSYGYPCITVMNKDNHDSLTTILKFNQHDDKDDAPLRIKMNYNVEDWPQLGTEVILAVEIMDDFLIHPNAWARVPTVGPWSDWNDMSRLAIMVSWWSEDEPAQYFERYLYNVDGLSQHYAPSISKAFDVYVNVIGMLRFFLRQPYIGRTPFWLRDFSLATVRGVHLDFLSHKVHTEPFPAEWGPRPLPQVKTLDEIEHDLKMLGIKQSLTWIDHHDSENGPDDPSDPDDPKSKEAKSCTACALVGLACTHANHGPCEECQKKDRIECNKHCDKCAKLGVVCCFWDAEVVKKKSKSLSRAIECWTESPEPIRSVKVEHPITDV